MLHEGADVALRSTHLSPTCSRDSNLSRDSGLTLSDTQLNCDDDSDRYPPGITLPGGFSLGEAVPKAPPRKHKRRGPSDESEPVDTIPEESIAPMYGRQASFTHSMNEEAIGKLRENLHKRRPVDPEAERASYPAPLLAFPFEQRPLGLLTKSPSGTRLFLEEGAVYTTPRRSNSGSCGHTPDAMSSQDSGVSSPFYTLPARPPHYSLECSASADFSSPPASAGTSRFSRSYSGSNDLRDMPRSRTVYCTNPASSQLFHMSSSCPITPDDSDEDSSSDVVSSPRSLRRSSANKSSDLMLSQLKQSPPPSVLLRRSMQFHTEPISEESPASVFSSEVVPPAAPAPPLNAIERSTSEPQVMRRSLPPPYQEAVRRSKLLRRKESPPMSDSDRIKLMVDSALAKQSHEASLHLQQQRQGPYQQLQQQHQPECRVGEQSAENGPTSPTQSSRSSVHRSKSDSQEHQDKWLRVKQQTRDLSLGGEEQPRMYPVTRCSHSASDLGEIVAHSASASPPAPHPGAASPPASVMFYTEHPLTDDGALWVSPPNGRLARQICENNNKSQLRPLHPPPYREPPSIQSAKHRTATPRKADPNSREYLRKTPHHIDRPQLVKSTDESFV